MRICFYRVQTRDGYSGRHFRKYLFKIGRESRWRIPAVFPLLTCAHLLSWHLISWITGSLLVATSRFLRGESGCIPQRWKTTNSENDRQKKKRVAVKKTNDKQVFHNLFTIQKRDCYTNKWRLTAKRKFSPVTWKQQIKFRCSNPNWTPNRRWIIFVFSQANSNWKQEKLRGYTLGVSSKIKKIEKKEELFFCFFSCKVRDHDRTRSGHDCIENHLGWVPRSFVVFFSFFLSRVSVTTFPLVQNIL